MRLKLGDVVLIEWEDHYSKNNGWVHLNETPKFNRYHCKSVGVVVYLTRNQVALAQNWHDTKEKIAPMVADFMVIMRKSISKVTRIKKQEIKL